MAHENEERLRRRLFESLEQRIGGFGIEIVGCIDDAHPPAARTWRVAEKFSRPAYVINPDLALDPACLGIEAALDEEQIGMPARSDATSHRRFGRDIQRRYVAKTGRVRKSQNEARKPVSEGGLPDPSPSRE